MKRQKRSIIILMTLMAFLALPAIIQAGQLTPTAPPAPTMKSLDEIYQKLTDINRDNQIIKGKLGVGPRFVDMGNGTVTDGVTGLVWLKNANPCGEKNWSDAMAYCQSLANGTAGLTDGSVAGQWRLPSMAELQGMGTNPPTTWVGIGTVTWTEPSAPFINVQRSYWSSTEYSQNTNAAYVVQVDWAYSVYWSKVNYLGLYVWPVRNPQ
jgi:hypothetical protein